MGKFTQGPWHVDRLRGKYTAYISGADWRKLAKVYVVCGKNEVEEGWANARLIAAAPEMYDCLKRYDEMMTDAWQNINECRASYPKRADLWESVRTVLTKVEGG